MNHDLTIEFYSLQWCSRTVCAFPAWLFTETKRNLKLIWYPQFFNPQKNMIKLQCNVILLKHDDKFVCFVTVFSVWIIFILQLKDEIRMWSCCKFLFTGMLPYTFIQNVLTVRILSILSLSDCAGCLNSWTSMILICHAMHFTTSPNQI